MALVGFTLLTAAPLLLIYPKKELTEKVTHAKLGDPVTVSYLTNLLRTDPNNMELRVFLAENKLYLGKIEEAPSLLEPVLKDTQSVWHIKARLTEIKYLVQLLATKNNDPLTYARISALLHGKMQGLVHLSMSQEDREYLAQQALSLNEPDLAGELYRVIAKSRSSAPGAEWYAAVAARMMSFSQYEWSAEFYFMARHHVVSRNEQKRYFYLGINALMSGNLFSAAMLAADKNLGGLSDDTETLYFLAKTALAANDTQRAEFYAKKLLHISMQDVLSPQWAILNVTLISSAYASERIVNSLSEIQGMRTFNASYYDLAFQIFLANRNLNDAFRVAEMAVRQVPDSLLWRQRLAEVSEWLGKPDVALREWSWLMNHSHSQVALQAILRLAPSMQDNDALLNAWMHLVGDQSLDQKQIETVTDLFEKTDRVKEGIIFFEQRYALTHHPIWLEKISYLAERSGDDKTAQKSSETLLEQHGFRSDILFRLVTFEMSRRHPQNALLLLQKYRSKVTSSDTTYWKILADLAWQLQQDDEAKDAYQHLAGERSLILEDISRYVFLLGDSQREQVAALAELGYQQFSERDMLLYALEVYGELHDHIAQQRLFDSAVNNRKLDINSSARFFSLRAQFRYESGLFKEARLDFLRAVKIAPDNKNILNALFWFLIDTHDQAGISDMIVLLKSKGGLREPIYWPALAAGYQTLEQPKQALGYFTAQIKRKPQDFLWQVNYADALEQAGQAELAFRARRNAWKKLNVQRATIATSLPMTPDLQAVVRLAAMSQPYDHAQNLMRSLLRQDKLVKQTVEDEEVLNQMVLVWALSEEQSANAKAWLWLRYAHMETSNLSKKQQDGTTLYDAIQLSLANQLIEHTTVMQNISEPQTVGDNLRLLLSTELSSTRFDGSVSGNAASKQIAPVWATSSLALETNDTEQMDKLFQHNKNTIPVKNRSDAALALGSLANAQDIIFESLTHNPDDEELQTRQLNNGLATSGFVETLLQRQQVGTWQGLQSAIKVEIPITSSTRVGVLSSGTSQSNSDQSTVTPPHEQVGGILIKSQNPLGSSELQWQRRSEFATTDVWLLNHAWKANERMDMQIHGLYHADTIDSLGLRTMGMQNGFSSSINYRLGLREYLSFQPGMSNYFTQQGIPLGHARQFAWEMGYRIQNDYPDWAVSLNGSQQNISPLAAGIGILPISNQLYSLCSNSGASIQSQYSQSIQSQYSHAWLPYLNTCLTSIPSLGLGYNAELGWVGSLFGRDQVNVSIGQSMNGTIYSQALIRELTVRYRYFFDQH